MRAARGGAPEAGTGDRLTTRMLTCEGCATRYDVSKRAPGKQVRCPRCRAVLLVPATAEEPRDARTSSSSRLRRAKGPSCRDHPRELALSRCRACGADVCGRCRADPPIDHFCRACSGERQLAGALPIDFGVVRTPLRALGAMWRALPRMLAWNLVGLLLTALLFVPLIALAFAGWDRAAPPAAVDLWRAVKADLFAGLVLGGALAWLISYYLLLVPAGCAVFLDAALRGRQLTFGEAFRDAWRRVARTGPSLVAVWLLLIMGGLAALMPGLAVSYGVHELAGIVPAGVVLLVTAGVAVLAFLAAIGVAVPVVVLEERPALEAIGRAWSLARPRVWDVVVLVLGYLVLHCVFSGGVWVLRAVLVGPGDVIVPALLVLVGHVVDLLWPALLVATYHGLAAEEAGVLGRA